MATLSARSLTQALSQARNIGLVEEPFVIGDVSVVVRNLRPDQYDAVFKECQGLSEVEYLNAWQIAHVARAICELNGVDLRDVQYVEDEEADPKRPGQVRTVKQEVHTWLRKNILSTWSRESIYICYRKVSDAIEGAEKQAQDGITFRVPDENAEERLRRLVGELKDIEGEVPTRLLDAILKDNGLMRRATVEEIEAAEAKLASLEAQPIMEQEPAPEPEPIPEPIPEPVQAPAPAPAKAGPPSPERMAQLLRNRVPLNQQPEAAGPMPVTQPDPAQAPTRVAQPAQAPVPTNAVQQSTLTGRTAQLAALEGSLPGETPATAVNLQPQDVTPEIRLGSMPKVNPDAAQAILDTPPTGGINPRFRPPVR